MPRVPPLCIYHNLRDGMRSVFSTRGSGGLPVNVEKFFGRDAVPLDSGRSALYAALSLLKLPKKSKVGVPVYTCSGVFDAIVAAGHDPVFIDIELEHYTIDAKSLRSKGGGLDVLVAVHTFGHPFDVDAVKEIIGDVPLIEDCAHAMAAKYKGKAVGTFGDAAIYSFRAGKLLGCGGGGMLVARDLDESKKSLIVPMMVRWSRWRLLAHYAQAVAGGVMSKSISALDSPESASGTMKVLPMAPGDLTLLERRIPSLPSIITAHRENAANLTKALEGGAYYLPLIGQSVIHDWYLFPLRFNTEEERKRAQIRLQKAGIGAFQLYHIALEKSRQLGYQGDCPNAEIAAKNVVILPVHQRVTEAAIRTMRDELRRTEADKQ